MVSIAEKNYEKSIKVTDSGASSPLKDELSVNI
jgi:hypothetical protein